MKINSLLVAFTVLTFTLPGCGDWNKDPLAGKDKRFQDGAPDLVEAPKEEAFPSDAVKITAPYSVSLEEEVLQKFEIFARVLIDGYDVHVEIENLEDLPGAQYDPQTKIFSWAPPLGFVDSSHTGDVWVDLPLKIRAFATKPGEVVHTAEQIVPLKVTRMFSVPEILRIEAPEARLREGEAMTVDVSFSDRDSDPGKPQTWTTLELHSLKDAKSMAGFLSHVETVHVSGTEYRSTFKLDLTSSEVTKDLDRYSVGFKTYSRYGKQGQLRRFALDFLTVFSTPITTWIETVEARVGEALTYRFLISDPKQETVLSIDSLMGQSENAEIACVPTNRGVLACTLEWTPLESETGDHLIYAAIKLRNVNSQDSLELVKSLQLRARVLPKGE